MEFNIIVYSEILAAQFSVFHINIYAPKGRKSKYDMKCRLASSEKKKKMQIAVFACLQTL